MDGFIILGLINWVFCFFNFYYANTLGRKKYTWFVLSLLLGGPLATIMLWSSNRMFAS